MKSPIAFGILHKKSALKDNFQFEEYWKLEKILKY